MENTIINEAITYVKKVFEHEYSGHDFFHTWRVYKTASHIAQMEHADLVIVQLAALLHDVDDRKLSPETAEHKDKAVHFMREHEVAENTIEAVCTIIGEISFSSGKEPSTIEGKCVQDADRLDAIGAIGIARAFTYGGNHNREMYNPDIKPNVDMSKEEYTKSQSTTINHFYEKLFKLKELMNTEAAKKLAEQREQFMQTYIDEFMKEWDGIC